MNAALQNTRSGRDLFQARGDIADDPDEQAMLRRLGEAVGDINAASVDRVLYVKQVAAAIRSRRGLM